MEKIIPASEDFRYLLGRGYPRPGALTFVGNHYQLPKDQRMLLDRGVHSEQASRVRRTKLVPPGQVRDRSVAVDGHNVIITLESAMLGRPLVVGDDGVIRDTAGLHGSYRPSEVTGQAIQYIFDYLLELEITSVLFLLDAALSLSGEMAAEIGAFMAGRGIMGRARAVQYADHEIITHPGLVATSDSVIIDRVKEAFDLAGNIIREKLPSVTPIRFR